MLHAPLPWSTVARPNNKTNLLDAGGRVIARFEDGRDADFVLDLFRQIDVLAQEIGTLENEIARLNETSTEQDNDK